MKDYKEEEYLVLSPEVELGAQVNGGASILWTAIERFVEKHGLLIMTEKPLPLSAASELAEILQQALMHKNVALQLRRTLTPPRS